MKGHRSGTTIWRGESNHCQFDDPINIQYTSGTTGLPKGATLSHHNILNNGWFVGEAPAHRADRVCVPVPFYHCFGMVLGNLACTSHGACIVVPGESSIRGRARSHPSRAMHPLYGVPTMFIADARASDVSQTRCFDRCEPASWRARRARSN